MKNYLTIGEFAKLRSVNVNSLLYYERLGIFNPKTRVSIVRWNLKEVGWQTSGLTDRNHI